jgi:CubicO group peptidase (beta-lactamase class C family)
MLPTAAAEIAAGIERGWHRGVAVSISREGTVVAEGAIGTSHDDVPLTSETLLPWLSAGKPLTAVCVLKLIEAGDLSLQTPVGEVVPEFAIHEHEVTVQHLLTHTAGLETAETGWPHASWDATIDTITAAGVREGWVPGERAAYDPLRGWFLLGEIVRRLTDRPIEQAVREEVLLPLGMENSWLAMSPELHRRYGDRIGRTWEVRGPTQIPTDAHLPPHCTSPSPGSSFRSPIGELRTFYEMLLAGGVTASGERLLQPSSVELMTQRHREGIYDETFRHTLDFGLGVIVNSRRYGAETVPYGYGPHASDETFGHGGARSCIAFADPQQQLAVCIAANGLLPEPKHQTRMRRLLDAVYDDLRIPHDTTLPDSSNGTQ